MANNLLTHETMNRIGGARAFLHVLDDASPTASVVLLELGAVADAEYSLSRDETNQEQRNEGKLQVIQKRILREEGMLTMRLLESINPVVLKYLLDPSTDPTINDGGGGTAYSRPGPGDATIFGGKEAKTLFGTTLQKLAHPYGILQSLEAATSLNVSAVAGIGNFDTADTPCSFALVAVYQVENISAAGQLFADAVYKANVTVADDNGLAVTWAAPAGVTPHHYELFVQKGAGAWVGVDNAIRLAVIDGDATSVVITDETDNSDYLAGGIIDAGATGGGLTVTSFDEGTAYVVDDDYTVDLTNGTIARVDGGAIEDGQTVVVQYVYTEQKNLEYIIGGGSSRAVTFPLTLLQVEKGLEGYEEGAEFYFHRVSPMGGPVSWTFRPDTFDNGIQVSFNTMLDPAEGNIGIVRSKTGVLDGITAIEF